MQKMFLLAVAAVILASFAAFATEIDLGAIEIVNSTVVNISIGSVPYGGATGTVKLRLGAFEWYPESVWIVPEGKDIGNFSYSGKTYRVPSSLNLTNNCVSSIYKSGSATAYKASVKADGAFCVLADPGSYRIVAEY